MDGLFTQLTELHGGLAMLAIFGVLLLCGFGLPIPEDIPIVTAGYLVHTGATSGVVALAVTMAGVLIGDSTIFYLGKRFGRSLFKNRLVRLLITRKRLAKTRAYYRKYGQKIIFAGRFMPGFRAPIFFVAGSSKVPYRKFITFDGLAAAVSVPVWLILGWAFGDKIESLLDDIQKGKTITMIVVGAVVVAYIAYLVIKARMAKKRDGEAGAEEEGG